jgi:protocatechuate 3,4-dioxygenase beta subunit
MLMAQKHPRFLMTFLSTILAALIFSVFHSLVNQTIYANDPPLKVEIQAAYNLVVDSNVSSPSTYAPRVATVAGRFCNTSGEPMTNVYGYIGNHATQTAGEYPATTDWVIDPGRAYAFTHIGGAVGTADATRYIGDLAPGECKVQYWSFTYPACAHDASGNPVEPPCTTTPTWGSSIKPDDELSMRFDMWATADGSGGPFADNASWTMTTRNEISAMANKIMPNPDGHWFNTDTSVVTPGSVITTNGVLYTLGNVRFGFDNDGDFVPDYNAWLQPFGDPSYDPSCFRLIGSSTVLTVSRSAGNPDLVIHTNDHNVHPTYGGPLYFTNLPPDNTGVRGEVRYTFLALTGPCALPISPYQEVASGYDNEKFNGDFGTGIPSVQSSEAQVTISKSGDPDSVALGAEITYSIPFYNESEDSDAGLTLISGGINMPLVIRDEVPEGLQYKTGSADISFDGYTSSATIRYSTDGGTTWTTTDPAGNPLSAAPNTVIIEWWLDEPVPRAEGNPPEPKGGTATFQAIVPADYINDGGDPFITNETCANFGNATDFACDTDVTMVIGDNSIGDFVWADLNANGVQDGGAETGIEGITVWLYWDVNGDGVLDDDALLIAVTETDENGAYIFPQLPPGDYLVVVDNDSSALPQGYANTTPAVHAVTGLSDVTDYDLADFGFGPVLSLIKRVVEDPGLPVVPPAYEGHPVTYEIELTNNLPGDGTGQETACEYTFWPADFQNGSTTGNRNFVNPALAFDGIENTFAEADWSGGSNRWMYGYSFAGLSNFDISQITKVETFARVYINTALIDDYFQLHFTSQTIANNSNNPGSGAEVTEVVDAATLNASYVGINNVDYVSRLVWEDDGSGWPVGWPDLTDAAWKLVVEIEKIGSADTGRALFVDNIGIRVTTNGGCGGPAGTIDPLPLTDTYEVDKLEFVSASVAPNSVTVDGDTGTINWSNVGPLHAGQTKTIEVTFLALEPFNNEATIVINEAEVTGATFSNGRPVNDADDEVTIGLEPTGSISGVVWNDNGAGGNHSNGVQDGDEAGIVGVTVYLCASSPCNSGNAVATTVTDTDGTYAFAGLLDGNYYTAVDTGTLPPGNSQTGDPDVPGENCSAGVCDNQTTDPVAVSGAADVTGIDYGYTVPNTIFGTIWHDHNGDGDLADATGVPGVTVHLYDNGTLVATTTTDANGRYLFDNVADGNYRIVVDSITLPDAAVADVNWAQTFDPDVTLDDQHAIPVTIENGNIYGSFDFAYYKGGEYSISGTVYADWNSNNELNGSEPGFAGIAVTLYDEDGNVAAVTTTDANGSYQFDDLPPGTFTVVVNENDLPTQYSQTQDPETPGDPCANCNGQGTVAIGNESIADFNFGYEPAGYGTIGDFVWYDINGDGYQNAGEPGLAAITLNLYVDYGNGYQLVDSTETNGSGFYSFTNLPPGDYRVEVDTADTNLPLDTNGTPYVPTTPTAVDVSLASGQTYLDADFGFAPGGIIGNTIYWDANSNADQDWNEPGIPDVTVNLQVWDGSNWVPYASDTTDSEGEYLFTGLPAGDYRVVVDTSSTLIAGKTLTGDPDTNGIPCDPDPGDPWSGFCDSTHTVQIRPGQTYLGANFGYRPTGVVGDFVWLDLAGDGVRSGGESGIPEVEVTISNGSETFATKTDIDGYYHFVDLDDGVWTLTFTTPSNMRSVAGTGSTAVENGNGSVGTTATVTIAGGVVTEISFTDANNESQTITCTGCDFHLDAAFTLAGDYNLSGTIFYDAENNGGTYNDAVDTPLAGMTVYLWQGSTFLGTTTTDANGFYQFPNLPPGDYATSISRHTPEMEAAAITTLDAPPQSFLLTTITDANVDQRDFGLYYEMDFGDLPAEYGVTLLSEDGARHLIPADEGERIFLGSSLTPKGDGLPAADANAHASDDGITRYGDMRWTAGTTVQLAVIVSGDSSDGYLVGWFDWNGDGNLEKVVLGENLATGSHLLDLTIPAGYATGSTVNARFRLYESEPDAILATGLVYNGEVEDYQWHFSPTAVQLQTLMATTPGNVNRLLLVVLVLLLVMTGLAVRRRQPLRA